MQPPPDILVRPAPEAARLMALESVAQAEEAADALALRLGGDCLHDFRVAVRRLRSTLRSWKGELKGRVRDRHRRALRDVQAMTGRGRDLEVATAWIEQRLQAASPGQRAGMAWLAGQFEARHGAAMDEVRAAVLADFAATSHRLRRRLRAPDPGQGGGIPPQTFAHELIQRLRDQMDDFILHLARLGRGAEAERAHRARILLKRLRYLVEPLRAVLPETEAFLPLCQRLQDLLGDLHDADVLAAELERTHIPSGAAGERIRPGLAALSVAVQARREQLLACLSSDWLVDLAAPLRALGNEMILTCTAAGPVPTEIERKFLLRGLPQAMPPAKAYRIHQGWLPGGHPRERLRHKQDESGASVWRRTLKGGRGLERLEVEEDVPREVFEVLWPLTAGCRVEKRRYVVPVGARAWEIDEFLDREGLYFAEIELASTDEQVEIPEWLAPVLVRDVTEEDGFTNMELAR